MTCAHAVRVAVEKLPGVEKAEVGLNRGTVSVTLRPGSPLTIARLLDLIKKQGHVTRKVRFTARAHLLDSEQFKRLEILGTGERFQIEPSKTMAEESGGQTHRITAEVSIPKDAVRLPPFQLIEVKPEW